MLILWNPKIGAGADEVTSSAPAPLKWSHSRCWRLSFRVLSAAADAACHSVWRNASMCQPDILAAM